MGMLGGKRKSWLVEHWEDAIDREGWKGALWYALRANWDWETQELRRIKGW
jgi:hypothetical protein